MDIVFCGTPKFAVPALDALHNAGHTIQLVVTQPDRPSGRGNHIAVSAVKQRALQLKIEVSQPEKLKHNQPFREQLEVLRPEAIVVVAYGRIIPSWMLELPRTGNFNLHASLLPRYRGAAPIQWAIANGDAVTGITIMQLDEGLDTGPILLQREVGITETDTAVTLAPRLADLGAELMVEVVQKLVNGSAHPTPQDHARATFAPLLRKDDGLVDFSRPAPDIHNRLRGFQPWPGAFTKFRGKQLEICQARPLQCAATTVPGTVILRDEQLLVGCGKNTLLEIQEVLPAGKKRITAREFVRGYRLLDNEKLG
jgi:methionyl-tRNA formyltransferase